MGEGLKNVRTTAKNFASHESSRGGGTCNTTVLSLAHVVLLLELFANVLGVAIRPDQTRRRDVRGPEWPLANAHTAERSIAADLDW
jgi:hypothetical protein